MSTPQETTGRRDQATRTAVPPMVPKAFLLAGIFFSVFAILWMATALTGADVETWRNGVIGPLGWVFAFGGLLGLYFHRFFDRASGWARAGALFAGIGVIGATLVAGWSLLQLAGAVADPPAALEGIGNAAILTGIIPAFGSFSVASFRTPGRTRPWGLLLAAPPAIFIVNTALGLAVGIDTVAADWVAVLAGTGQALAMFAILYALRNGDGSPAGAPVDSSAARRRVSVDH